eukprot:3270651-Rhodomonas_salina.1
MLGTVSKDRFEVPSLRSEKVGDQLARSLAATVGSVFCKQPWASMDYCLHLMQLTKQSLESTLAHKEQEAGLQTWIGRKLLFKKLIALEADSTTEESLMAKTDLCNLC